MCVYVNTLPTYMDKRDTNGKVCKDMYMYNIAFLQLPRIHEEGQPRRKSFSNPEKIERYAI